MYSTRCTNCRQLVNLNNEEVRLALAEAEEKKEKVFVTHCPKCRRVVKIQVKDLKRTLPLPAPQPAEHGAEESESSEEASSS